MNINFIQSYGAMSTLLSYLPASKQTCMQALCRWLYDVGVSRVQTRISLRSPLHFLWHKMGSHVFQIDYTVGSGYQVNEREVLNGEFCDQSQRMVQVGHYTPYVIGGKWHPNQCAKLEADMGLRFKVVLQHPSE